MYSLFTLRLRSQIHVSQMLMLINQLFFHSTAEANRRREYDAAVKIQSWYRALRARAYLRYLVECSNIIQKRFRGHQSRREFRVYLKVIIAVSVSSI